MTPPGEATSRRTAWVSRRAAAQQLGRAREGLHDQLRSLGGGDATANAGVDLGLGDERDVGGCAGHQAHGDVDERVGEHDERAELGEQRLHARVEVGVLGRVGRLHHGALAHLDGERGDEAVHGPVGIGGVQRSERRGGEDRGDGTRVRGQLARHVLQLSRLVAENDQIGAFGHLSVVRERFAADLSGQSSGALGERVGAQQRTTPPARERAGHVA